MAGKRTGLEREEFASFEAVFERVPKLTDAQQWIVEAEWTQHEEL